MGIGVADFDGDGWTDVFVANDTEPNYLFRNAATAASRRSAFEAGVAYPESGRPLSGMGADARDVDNDGRPDVFHTALSNETFPCSRTRAATLRGGDGARAASRRSRCSRAGWGNGIVRLQQRRPQGPVRGRRRRDGPERRVPARRCARPTSCSRTSAGPRFADASAAARGATSPRKAVHRGAAFGDLDGDGRVDAVVTALDERVEVWRNVSPGGQPLAAGAADGHAQQPRRRGRRDHA